MYFGGVRQGTGTYFYAGGYDEDGIPMPGGVYMGEWLKGKMHGYGILSYSDGEYYVGQWKYDQKHGLGVSPAPVLFACYPMTFSSQATFLMCFPIISAGLRLGLGKWRCSGRQV